jgi:hypothetical protein
VTMFTAEQGRRGASEGQPGDIYRAHATRRAAESGPRAYGARASPLSARPAQLPKVGSVALIVGLRVRLSGMCGPRS